VQHKERFQLGEQPVSDTLNLVESLYHLAAEVLLCCLTQQLEAPGGGGCASTPFHMDFQAPLDSPVSAVTVTIPQTAQEAD
jgi:hypothetical protein